MNRTIAEFLTELVYNCDLLRAYLADRSSVAAEFGLSVTQIAVLTCGDNEVLKCVIAQESGEAEAEKLEGDLSLMVA